MNQADQLPTKSSNAVAEQNSQRKFSYDPEVKIIFASYNIKTQRIFIAATIVALLIAFTPQPPRPIPAYGATFDGQNRRPQHQPDRDSGYYRQIDL